MGSFASHLLRVCIVTLLLAAASLAAEEKPITTMLGQAVADFRLTDVAGKRWALQSLRDKKAVVLVFFSFDCPVSASYTEPLNNLARDYAGKGVAVVGIVPGSTVEAADVRRQVREYQAAFPVLLDPQLRAVSAVAATVTPEAFLLDGELVLRYRGRIDDTWAKRLKSKLRVSRHDLRLALDELLAGKPPSVPATEAIGCQIDREARPVAADGPVTYYRDVQPILRAHCQGCHRPDQIGPFALTTYAQAVHWAVDIKEFTRARQMPPWLPTQGPGFQHERHLSERELATLAAWADAGTPAGKPRESAAAQPGATGWPLGEPDLLLTPPDDFHLGAHGRDVSRCFVIPTNRRDHAWVTAVDVQPDCARVVHHVRLFIDTTGQGRRLEQDWQQRQRAEVARDRGKVKDQGPGYSVLVGVGFTPTDSLGCWLPNQKARQGPAGSGYFLPRGADVVVQVRYRRDGRPETDRTTVGLYFARHPIQKRLQEIAIPGPTCTVPAGVANCQVRSRVEVRHDCVIHSILPQLYLLGRQLKVTMTPPSGQGQTLIAIADWDHNWEQDYFFQKPITVKAGTRFTLEVVYDNSARNWNNPTQPPQAVVIGPHGSAERSFAFLGATTAQPGPIRVETLDP